MGSFYTNFAIKSTQARVVRLMKTMKRSSYVSPTMNGVTFLYDRESDQQDEGVICKLGKRLSRELRVAVLAVLNHDDDVLQYWLFCSGTLRDTYNSTPNYFFDAATHRSGQGVDLMATLERMYEARLKGESCFPPSSEATPAPPSGGNARLLCKTFGKSDSGKRVESILKRPDYVFAYERHKDLASSLRLAWPWACLGVRSIDAGSLPKGAKRQALVCIT